MAQIRSDCRGLQRPSSYQDAEKRILNGKWAMGNGKKLSNLPSPISHFPSGRLLSAAV
jgi:hypothetical protein